MDRRKIIFGLVLILIGLLLLGRSLEWLDYGIGDVLRLLFPVALILFGIWLILRKKRQEDQLREHMNQTPWSDRSAASTSFQQPHRSGESPSSAQATAAPVTTSTGTIKYSKLLGDLFVDCNGVGLQNVEVSVGIGDVEIKLHGGKLHQGLNRLIISGFIGDVRVYVPPDMPHFVHSSNFIGDVEAGGQKAGGFSNTIESQTPDYEAAEKRLYIAANNFIGDIKVFVI